MSDTRPDEFELNITNRDIRWNKNARQCIRDPIMTRRNTNGNVKSPNIRN